MNSTCVAGRAPALLLLQPLWDALGRRRGALSCPCVAVAVALLAHTLLSLPFLLLDVVGARKPDGDVPPEPVSSWLKCFCRIVRKYAYSVLPVTVLAQRLRPEGHAHRDVPTGAGALLEVIACLLIFDTLFYAWHVVMHKVPWLYQKVHRDHHQSRELFALRAQDASAAELLSLQMLALASTAIVGCHPLTEAFFHLLNIWLALEDHSGYDLPCSVHRLLPYFGGAPFHQAHHHRGRGNYAPYFTHWDKLWGTYLKEEEDSVPDKLH